MKLPIIIIQVAEIIQQQLSISPEKDEVIDISLWDFRGPDKENDLIPKEDLKKILRTLEEKGLFVIVEGSSLDQKGRKSEDVIKLKINRKKIKDFYTEQKSTKDDQDPTAPIEFNDNDAALIYQGKRCQLPPYKNEHFFCRAVFEYPKNEPVDWSSVFEKMTGYGEDSIKGAKEESRKVYDSMEALNKRVEKVFGIKNFFIWREKTVTRTR